MSEEKNKIKEYQKKRYQKLIHYKKEALDLDLVDTGKIVVFGKFRHSEEGSKFFIGYQEDEIVKPLCIISRQTNGYIKYFDNGGKNVFIN